MDPLEYFGFKDDPFEPESTFESADVRSVAEAVGRCVKSRSWIAIRGPWGSGKSFAVNAALARKDIRLVAPQISRRGELSTSHIEYEIIEGHAHESPRANRVARLHQLRRVLGVLAQEGPVVILLEEANLLRRETLGDIKRLREMMFAGSQRLFATIMVGTSSGSNWLSEKVGREILWRIKICEMRGLKKQEVGHYLAHLGLARCMTNGAVEEFASAMRQSDRRLPLELNAQVWRAMDAAMDAGHKKIDRDDVIATQESVARLMAILSNHTQAALAKRLGIAPGTSKSQLSHARKALRRLLEPVKETTA